MFAIEADRALDVEHAADDGDGDGGGDAEVANVGGRLQISTIGEHLVVVHVNQDDQDRDRLHDHLQLAAEGCAEVLALAFTLAAQAGNEQFAGHEDDDDARRDAADRVHALLHLADDLVLNDEVLTGKEGERAQDQDLINERIDDAAECAFDLPAAGEEAVEKIGDQRDEVNDERNPEKGRVAAPFVLVVGQHAEEDHRQ